MRTLLVLAILILSSFWLLQADTTSNVISKDVVYASPDDHDLRIAFVHPKGEETTALIIFVHGGGWQAGSYKDYSDMQQRLAGLGFASASVQYRLAPKSKFPAQLNDVLQAIDFLTEHQDEYHIDPQRVGLIGGSAGGHLALLAGFAPSEKHTIKAIVNMNGPTDLRSFQSTETGDAHLKAGSGRDSTGLLIDLLGTDDKAAEIYAQASPVAQIRKDLPPVLTIHGTKDDIVPFAQAEELHAALKKISANETLIPIEGADHSFAGGDPKKLNDAILAMVAFFSVHLKK